MYYIQARMQLNVLKKAYTAATKVNKKSNESLDHVNNFLIIFQLYFNTVLNNNFYLYFSLKVVNMIQCQQII